MLHLVQFSGGKDSTALVLWAREQWGDKGFTAVFCDTGWEHPLTYAYVEHINRTVLGGRLVRIKSTRYPGGMLELVAKRVYIPAARSRFCTQELKIFPMEAYCKTLADEFTVYQGVRGDESDSRRAAGERVWSDEYDGYIERPLFHWTVEQVFAIHATHGIEPNPLYKLGASRVGCFPCIYMNLGEWRRVGTMLPEAWDRARAVEVAVDAAKAERVKACEAEGKEVPDNARRHTTWFRPDRIPMRFCRSRDEITNQPVPSIEDVRRYVEDERNQGKLFEEPAERCMSVYNLCE